MRDPFARLLDRLTAFLRTHFLSTPPRPLPPHVDLAVWTAAPLQTWTSVPEFRRAIDRLGSGLGLALTLSRAQAQPVCLGRVTYVAVRVGIAPRRDPEH